MKETELLWNRAKSKLTHGNMLLSKRPEMFAPSQWPAYFSEAKGCFITTLDNETYLDMSLMSVGTNMLGYARSEVDSAVTAMIRKGSMSTLNAPEEVYLIERLLELHSWADKGTLARTGGEAAAIAVRFGRIASGKNRVAICGYHGWHDWYLAANLNAKDGLDQLLLKGINHEGVPSVLKGSTVPFSYNDLETLEAILESGDVGVIAMEVQRNVEPDPCFLHGVRTLADQYSAVLIFDECTSGFRCNFGGLHLIHGVCPDLAIFGKALGNGFPITAILGTDEVLKDADKSFVSSTFWSDRVGPVAGLATLAVMQQERTWDITMSLGLSTKQEWANIAEACGLHLSITGLDSMPSFTIESEYWPEIKTYISQQFLKNGILGSNSIYYSSAHADIDRSQYFEVLAETLLKLSSIDFAEVRQLLAGPACHNGFTRLN